MKTHKEMFEALLAGETLEEINEYTLCLHEDNLLFKNKDGLIAPINNLYLRNPMDWRIKQKTININGFEVPEPVRFVIEVGTAYYIPIITTDIIMPKCYYWCNNEQDNSYLVKGLVHLTPESALLHAKALLSFTQKE